MKYTVFLVYLAILIGCTSSQTYDDTEPHMTNKIYTTSDGKPKKIILQNKSDINPPTTIQNDENMDIGDGLLFYKISNFMYSLKIPKNKKAILYIESNNTLLMDDLKKSLSRYKQIKVVDKLQQYDYGIEVIEKNGSINLYFFDKHNMIKKILNVDLQKLKSIVNNNPYILLKYNGRLFQISQNTTYTKEVDNTPDDEKISEANYSFGEAKDYCKKQNMILPKLYIFEKARQLGYLHPPVGHQKEFIYGYYLENKKQKDILPEDYLSIIIYDWGNDTYTAYSGTKIDDKIFKSTFRCMKKK